MTSSPTKSHLRGRALSQLSIVLAALPIRAGAETTESPITYPAGSIFDWEPSPNSSEPRAAGPIDPASGGGFDDALFRSVLQDPHYDSETFWIRDQKWVRNQKKMNAAGPPALSESPDLNLTFVHYADLIPLSELSIALVPLSLGGGLLLLRRKWTPAGNYPAPIRWSGF